jgi:hypothetical protein
MIDLTNILKDAPKGTELYCPIYGILTFDSICEPKHEHDYAIKTLYNDTPIYFTKYGRYTTKEVGECVLFPSENNRSWDNVDFKPKREDLPNYTPVVTFSTNPSIPQELIILYYDKNGHCYVNENSSVPIAHIVPVDKFDFKTLSYNPEDDYGFDFSVCTSKDIINLLKKFC